MDVRLEGAMPQGARVDLSVDGTIERERLDNPRFGHTEDPMHLNDVEVLRDDMAAAFPLFAAGDVMVRPLRESAM